MEINKQHSFKKKKWFLPLVLSFTLTTFLVLISIFTSSSSSSSSSLFYKTLVKNQKENQIPAFVEPKVGALASSAPRDAVPRLAYLISGSAGDGLSLKRTLKALYHPRNQYVVHLDLESSLSERLDLAEFVRREKVFAQVGNVRMVKRANLVTYRGPTMVTNTLHAAAILLKEGGDWDWFINLSASDYPLVTQDDLLHTLSNIPRNLNFIDHTTTTGWKVSQRAMPVIIDPGLYSTQKSDVFWASERRSVPTAFKLFTGSAWMMLSRDFMEFCIWGWDNLPRIVLMYYANFLSSPEGYFHTVICNAEEFRNTTVNHDLHYISWDNPPRQHPHFLTDNDFGPMVSSNAPFARKFGRNATVLDKIDAEILGRNPDGFFPGEWLLEDNAVGTNTSGLRPGPGAERLKILIDGLLNSKDFSKRQCL